ncbi:MAG TPA: PH domain-containing protein [Polyangiaceae bacterium]|nr:PH domain-containing protein [Polyangiaceae bacterium]
MTPSPGSAQPPEETLYEGRPAVIPGVGALLVAVLTLGLGYLYMWVRTQGLSYKITTRRVLVERGLLSKRLEQIDCFRIKDFVVDRPVGQRMLGTGNILLLTADSTTPAVELRNLRTDVVALYEKLRAAADADRTRRAVRIVDNE